MSVRQDGGQSVRLTGHHRAAGGSVRIYKSSLDALRRIPAEEVRCPVPSPLSVVPTY